MSKNLYRSLMLISLLIILTWIIMFKCNLLTNDLRFGYQSLNLVPFRYYGGKDGILSVFTLHFFLNFLVFIPYGFYLAIGYRQSIIKTSLYTFLLAFIFEGFQYILAFGSSDITDCIANTFGGFLGALLALLFKNVKIRYIDKIVLIFSIILSIFAITTTIMAFPIYL